MINQSINLKSMFKKNMTIINHWDYTGPGNIENLPEASISDDKLSGLRCSITASLRLRIL